MGRNNRSAFRNSLTYAGPHPRRDGLDAYRIARAQDKRNRRRVRRGGVPVPRCVHAAGHPEDHVNEMTAADYGDDWRKSSRRRRAARRERRVRTTLIAALLLGVVP